MVGRIYIWYKYVLNHSFQNKDFLFRISELIPYTFIKVMLISACIFLN
jgi:hypothetical protein